MFYTFLCYSKYSQVIQNLNHQSYGGQNKPRRIRVDTRGTATYGLAERSRFTAHEGDSIVEIRPGGKVLIKREKGLNYKISEDG